MIIRVTVSVLALLMRTLLVLSALCFVVLLVLLTLEMIARYVEGSSIPGLHEGVQIAFLYIYFFGAAEAYARRGDIRILTVANLLPARVRPWLEFFISLTVSATAAVLAWYGFEMAFDSMDELTPALRIPEGLRILPLGFAGLIMMLIALLETLADIAWIGEGSRPDYLKPLQSNHPAKGTRDELSV